METKSFLTKEYVDYLTSDIGRLAIKNFSAQSNENKCLIFKNQIVNFISSVKLIKYHEEILNKVCDGWLNAKIHYIDVTLEKNIFTITVYLERPGFVIGMGGELYDVFHQYFNEKLSFGGFKCKLELKEFYPFKPTKVDFDDTTFF